MLAALTLPLSGGSGWSVSALQLGAPRAGGAVIEGRILDRLGQPMKNVHIELLVKDVPSGTFGRAGHDTFTADSGTFRLSGLDAGRYYLCGTTVRAGPGSPSSEYAPTCYPGVARVADARPIVLTVAEVRDGSFAMQVAARLATVSGAAMDANRRPVPAGTVLLSARAGFPGPLSGTIQANGRFAIPGVPPGDYVASTSGPSSQTRDQQYRPDRSVAAVTVGASDISGVVVAPVKAVTVSGRLIVPVNSAATTQTRFIRIGVVEASPQPFVGPPPPAAVVNPDLTFQLQAPALPVMIQVLGAGPLLETAVRIGGRNFIDTPIDLRSGQDVRGVEIELTESPSLTATAIAGSAAANDWCLVVFPQDRTKWTSRDYLGHSFTVLWHITARPFTIRTLAPGRYYAVALSRFDNEWRDPDFLETLRPRATAFELGEAERKALRLQLVTLP
jgi:hypothetical protein